jgi:putative ABC transport system ATP-binding protein
MPACAALPIRCSRSGLAVHHDPPVIGPAGSEPAAEVLLDVSGLGKSFGGQRVLDDLNLKLAAGNYIAVMGESGAGKSTLLNLIAGLDMPDAGSVRFLGQNLYALNERDRTLLRRQAMGFVFQAFHLLPHLTVAQNVELPLALNGVDAGPRRDRVGEMLAAVGLEAKGERYSRQLSGGEMQRVALARALAHRPRLLLADEPTGNLDRDNAAAVLALLREQAREQGCAAILVTHSAAAAAGADKVYLLERGALKPHDPGTGF